MKVKTIINGIQINILIKNNMCINKKNIFSLHVKLDCHLIFLNMCCLNNDLIIKNIYNPLFFKIYYDYRIKLLKS